MTYENKAIKCSFLFVVSMMSHDRHLGLQHRIHSHISYPCELSLSFFVSHLYALGTRVGPQCHHNHITKFCDKSV